MVASRNGQLSTPAGSVAPSVSKGTKQLMDSADPWVIGSHTSKTNRNSWDDPYVTAAKRGMIAWVDGVGWTGYDGTAWVHISGSKRETDHWQDYADLGPYALSGQQDSLVPDADKLTLSGLTVGDRIRCHYTASITVDPATLEQTVKLMMATTGCTQMNSAHVPVRCPSSSQSVAYQDYHKILLFNVTSATATLRPGMSAGTNAARIILTQFHLAITVYPGAAAA